MATTFCTSCGRAVPAGATFCPGCGAAVAAAAASVPVASPSPSPYAAFGRGGPQDPRMTPEGRAAEGRGLRAVRAAMLLAVVGALFGVGEQVYARLTPFLSVGRTGSGLDLTLGNLAGIEVVIAIAAALTVAEFAFLRIGFSSLVGIVPGESTPAALAVVAAVGFLMLFGGVALLFEAFRRAIQCAGGVQPIPTSCLVNSTLGGGIALLVLGAIVGLVGYIGVLIGLYRIGDAYRDSTIKVGTILLIFPFISVIGAILIWYRAGETLRRQGAPVGPGSLP
ncbi:MAG TPA: DUF973 family protein [Thermoplasmata archaeon]|nr:DUF973 family protein [Thermoplasmata archaeon]